MWSGNRYDDERNGWRRAGSRPDRSDEQWREDEEFQAQTHRFSSGPDYDRELNRGRGGSGRWGEEGGGGRGYGEREYGSRSSGAQGSHPGAYSGGHGGGTPRSGSYSGGRDHEAGSRMDENSYQGSSRQADGWSGEPAEMRWNRQQGLYGSSEYGGYLSSQRSQSSFQSNAGKGPRGWQRSDERISEEVNEALARHPDIDATDIEVKVQGGEVTLTGTVAERRDKRLAEDVVERVFGVKDVQNQLKHKPSERGGTFQSDREVTRAPDREGRATTEGQDKGRRTGTSAGSGMTTG